MKKFHKWVALSVLTTLVGVTQAQQPATASLKKSAEMATAALARLDYNMVDEILGSRPRIGQAICIDAANGVFLTGDIRTDIVTKQLQNIKLTPAGQTSTGIDAEILGQDPEQSLTFLKVKGPHKWKALRFSRAAKLDIGDRVISVGLLGPNAGNVPYLGTGFVGAKLRVPHRLYYVAGGELTITSSPVLTVDGRVVGMVRGELPMEQRMQLAPGRWADVATIGRQRTKFFQPVDEFAHVLQDIPTPAKPRRLSWVGILRFEIMLEKEAELRGLQGKAAVLVGQVVPDTIAGKAGIKQSDAIIGINGKPVEMLPTPKLVRDNFTRTMRRQKPGQVVKLTIWRSGKPVDYSLKAVPMPTHPYEAKRYYNRDLGLAVRDLVMLDRYGQQGETMMDPGVRVYFAVQKSPAAAGPLAAGDVITHVNNKPVANIASFKAVLDPISKPGSTAGIKFLVMRRGTPELINVIPPRKRP